MNDSQVVSGSVTYSPDSIADNRPHNKIYPDLVGRPVFSDGKSIGDDGSIVAINMCSAPDGSWYVTVIKGFKRMEAAFRGDDALELASRFIKEAGGWLRV